MTAEGSNEPHHLPPQLSHWTTSRLLMALLSAGVSTEGRRYSLKNAPLERLLDIYPLRVAERLKPFVIMESTGSDVVLGRGDSEEDAWRDAAERLKANGENSWQVFSQAAGVGRETETTDPRG